MKDFLIIIVLLGIITAFIASAISGALLDGMDAATAAIKAYPSAEVGHLIAYMIIAKWNIEVAKLMFWIHLFS